MQYFVSHQLIHENGACIVRLYLDKQLTEFSLDFLGVHKNKKREAAQVHLEDAVRSYIHDKLPGIKITAAYIIFGSLLIASIPLLDNAPNTADYPAAPTYAVSDRPHNPSENETPAPAEHLQPDNILVLVNKQNPLPADYVPENLVVPDVRFTFNDFREVRQMRQDAASALEELFKSAERDNIRLYAVSGYRSYAKQTAVFASSVKRHGSEAEANQYSARAGQSEHQTGLSMDVTSASADYALSERFGQTKEGKWLTENAYRFGFIIRYGQGNESITGYQYEPWHIRFVGTEAATAITSQNITLEEYF